MLKSSLMHYRYCCRPPKLTLVRDIIITITASWNYDFRGHSILTPCLGLNQSYSHLLQIAKNYIKALNEMIRQTDADSGIFQEIPSPSQLLLQQQAIKFAFWDTRTLTFQDIHSPSQLQQQQAIKFAFWVTLKLKVQDIHSYSQLLQQQQAIKFAFWVTLRLTFQEIQSSLQLQNSKRIEF